MVIMIWFFGDQPAGERCYFESLTTFLCQSHVTNTPVQIWINFFLWSNLMFVRFFLMTVENDTLTVEWLCISIICSSIQLKQSIIHFLVRLGTALFLYWNLSWGYVQRRSLGVLSLEATQSFLIDWLDGADKWPGSIGRHSDFCSAHAGP